MTPETRDRLWALAWLGLLLLWGLTVAGLWAVQPFFPP